MVKKTLLLLNDLPNLFDLPQATISQYTVDPSDKEIFLSSVKIFLNKSKDHFTNKYVLFHARENFDYFDIVKISKYPLPAVYNTSTKRGIINISALQKKSISNIDMRDLYATTVYAHVCSLLSAGVSIPVKFADIFCDYMSFVFLKIFSKSYGIAGSYLYLVPKTRFLVSLYVMRSFFDVDMKIAIPRCANIAKYDLKSLDIDLSKYDFTNIKDFIMCMSDSQVTPGLNIYKFTDKMIRNIGVMNLPFFEDISRFSSIMMAASVNGNSYFSPAFQMYNNDLYYQVISAIQTTIDSAMK